jgi:hypothetical protein
MLYYMEGSFDLGVHGCEIIDGANVKITIRLLRTFKVDLILKCVLGSELHLDERDALADVYGVTCICIRPYISYYRGRPDEKYKPATKFY